MPYNFVADSIHTKKLCNRLFQVKCNFTRKTAVLRFWAPLGGSRATYDVHLRLIGKIVVDFLLVLIELFFATCYGWGATANIDRKSAFSLQPGQFGLPFQVEGVAPTNHSSCQKTRMNDLLCGIRMWAQVSFFMFVTIHVWQTDGQADKTTLTLPCVALHAVAR